MYVRMTSVWDYKHRESAEEDYWVVNTGSLVGLDGGRRDLKNIT